MSKDRDFYLVDGGSESAQTENKQKSTWRRENGDRREDNIDCVGGESKSAQIKEKPNWLGEIDCQMNGHRDDEKMNGHRDHNRGNQIDGQIDDDLNLFEFTSVSICDKKTLELMPLEINTLQPEMQKCLSNRPDANHAETGELEMIKMVIDMITENTDADMMTYSKLSGRY